MAPSWLARLPAVLFAMPVGLFGLAAAWRRARGFGWSFAEPVGVALAWAAAALAAVLVLLYAAKCLRHPRVIAVEFANPVTGSLMALIPLSLLLGTVCFGTAGQTGWLTLTLVALALQGVVAMRVVSILATGELLEVRVLNRLFEGPMPEALQRKSVRA